MKIKIPLLFIIVGLQSTFAQVGSQRENKSHLTDMQLLGKVKTFKITPYKLVDYFGKVTKGEKQDFWRGDAVIVFDEQGFKKENNTYNKLGQLNQKVIYKYDDKGKRTSRDLYNSYGKLQMKFLYVYDNKGFKTAYNSYSPTGELNDSYLYKVITLLLEELSLLMMIKEMKRKLNIMMVRELF